jgi:cytidylate kinase
LVIDSRTAWHWIPHSFKVFLNLDIKIAAQRILKELSEERLVSENVHTDAEAYAKLLQHRLDVETERYKSLYGINPYDMANYDLIIDTANQPIDEVINEVIGKYRGWLNQ